MKKILSLFLSLILALSLFSQGLVSMAETDTPTFTTTLKYSDERLDLILKNNYLNYQGLIEEKAIIGTTEDSLSETGTTANDNIYTDLTNAFNRTPLLVNGEANGDGLLSGYSEFHVSGKTTYDSSVIGYNSNTPDDKSNYFQLKFKLDGPVIPTTFLFAHGRENNVLLTYPIYHYEIFASAEDDTLFNPESSVVDYINTSSTPRQVFDIETKQAVQYVGVRIYRLPNGADYNCRIAELMLDGLKADGFPTNSISVVKKYSNNSSLAFYNDTYTKNIGSIEGKIAVANSTGDITTGRTFELNSSAGLSIVNPRLLLLKYATDTVPEVYGSYNKSDLFDSSNKLAALSSGKTHMVAFSGIKNIRYLGIKSSAGINNICLTGDVSEVIPDFECTDGTLNTLKKYNGTAKEITIPEQISAVQANALAGKGITKVTVENPNLDLANAFGSDDISALEIVSGVGSKARDFAKANNLKFIYKDSDVLLGDYNDDRITNVADFVRLKKVLAGANVSYVKNAFQNEPDSAALVALSDILLNRNNKNISKYGISVNADETERNIKVDLYNTIKENFMSSGGNTFPESLSAEAYGEPVFLDPVAFEVERKRIINSAMGYTRLLFNIDAMVTNVEPEPTRSDIENNRDYQNYKAGIYDFESDSMQSFWKYMEIFKTSGTKVYLNTGWKASDRIQPWYSFDCDVLKDSAPREINYFVQANMALLEECEKRYPGVVTYLCYGNEFTNEKDFTVGENIDKYTYHTELTTATREGLDTLNSRLGTDIKLSFGEDGYVDGETLDAFVSTDVKNSVDAYSFHMYLRNMTESKLKYRVYDNYFDNLKMYVDKYGKDVFVNETINGMVGKTDEALAWNWNTTSAAQFIATANSGATGFNVWDFATSYWPNPLYTLNTDYAHHMWSIPIARYDSETVEENLNKVNQLYYSYALMQNYVPSGSDVLWIDWSGKDLRTAAFKLPDGNYTILVEANKSELDKREINIELNKSLNKKVYRFVYNHNTEVTSDMLTPLSDKNFPYVKRSISDTINGDYGLYVYTTMQPKSQLSFDGNSAATVTNGETCTFDLDLIDCPSGSKINWSISSVYHRMSTNKNSTISNYDFDDINYLADKGSIEISNNGKTCTYTAPTTIYNGDRIAIRAELDDDPSVCAVAIVSLTSDKGGSKYYTSKQSKSDNENSLPLSNPNILMDSDTSITATAHKDGVDTAAAISDINSAFDSNASTTATIQSNQFNNYKLNNSGMSKRNYFQLVFTLEQATDIAQFAADLCYNSAFRAGYFELFASADKAELFNKNNALYEYNVTEHDNSANRSKIRTMAVPVSATGVKYFGIRVYNTSYQTTSSSHSQAYFDELGLYSSANVSDFIYSANVDESYFSGTNLLTNATFEHSAYYNGQTLTTSLLEGDSSYITNGEHDSSNSNRKIIRIYNSTIKVSNLGNDVPDNYYMLTADLNGKSNLIGFAMLNDADNASKTLHYSVSFAKTTAELFSNTALHTFDVDNTTLKNARQIYKLNLTGVFCMGVRVYQVGDGSTESNSTWNLPEIALYGSYVSTELTQKSGVFVTPYTEKANYINNTKFATFGTNLIKNTVPSSVTVNGQARDLGDNDFARITNGEVEKTQSNFDLVYDYTDAHYLDIVYDMKSSKSIKKFLLVGLPSNSSVWIGKYCVYASTSSSTLFDDANQIYNFDYERDGTSHTQEVSFSSAHTGRYVAIRIYNPTANFRNDALALKQIAFFS